MRRFYLEWESRVPQIAQKPSGQFVVSEIAQKASGELAAMEMCQTPSGKSDAIEISQQPIGKSGTLQKGQSATDQFGISEKASRKLGNPFTISWSHYVLLLTIKDPDERSFYEIEATNAGWSVPELKRQKASCLYERLALSRDKDSIRRLAKEGQVIVRPEDLLK
jgi:hypothetical protein